MNHLGDTNKMVSGNPRMDASAHDDGAIWQTGCDIERKLNAANERIKRLEEVLYKIEFYAATGILQDSFDEIKRIAKEAKL